jgi:hypothetical protein
MARSDALVCPSVFSRNREFKSLGHEQMACGFSGKCDASDLAAVTASVLGATTLAPSTHKMSAILLVQLPAEA